MKTSTFIDKGAWPRRGPWDSEPDKAQWTDSATGLPCLIVRNGLGSLCGYVGVAEGHTAFERNDGDDLGLEVHGGITFTGFCQEGGEEHGICHVPEPGQPERVWWLGFDTGHSGDLSPACSVGSIGHGRMNFVTYRDFTYVKSEVERLAAQMIQPMTAKDHVTCA